MISLSPLYAIVGVAFVSKFAEDFLMESGRGDWVWLLKMILYVGVGIFALSIWHDYVRMIAGIFGVMVP